MIMGCSHLATGVQVALMSISSSLVFATLNCRWFCSHHTAKLSTTALYSSSHYCRVIRKLLKVAGLSAVAELRGVQGEEIGRDDDLLQGSCVFGHTV